jgi:4-hydroxy-tetrahydrodipicolinate reductase
MRALILGAGAMGRALRSALEERGDEVVAILGRPDARTERTEARAERPGPTNLAPVDVAFEFSHASTILRNVRYALDAGARSIVVGTTGWSADEPTRAALDAQARDAGTTIVHAPTFSLGAVLFSELAESAARLFGRFEDYDAFLLEWHRRTKPDRPSGTALAIAERLVPHLRSKRQARLAEGQSAPDPETLEVVALRAGASPGMHLVGFDAPGESIELRLTARDRSAYVAGALLAADRLVTDPARTPGLHRFDALVRELLATDPAASTADPTELPNRAA